MVGIGEGLVLVAYRLRRLEDTSFVLVFIFILLFKLNRNYRLHIFFSDQMMVEVVFVLIDFDQL